jgi:hypothetical protein
MYMELPAASVIVRKAKPQRRRIKVRIHDDPVMHVASTKAQES